PLVDSAFVPRDRCPWLLGTLPVCSPTDVRPLPQPAAASLGPASPARAPPHSRRTTPLPEQRPDDAAPPAKGRQSPLGARRRNRPRSPPPGPPPTHATTRVRPGVPPVPVRGAPSAFGAETFRTAVAGRPTKWRRRSPCNAPADPRSNAAAPAPTAPRHRRPRVRRTPRPQ